MKETVIALTGHRPKSLLPSGESWSMNHPLVGGYGTAIRRELLRQAGFDPVTKEWGTQRRIKLISGMALGIDTIGALVLLKLKRQFPHLFSLECAIPCQEQERKWRKEDQERYQSILAEADSVTYVSEDFYHHGCMQKRNEYMVDQADVVLAVWNGSRSGTGNCVIYALEQEKSVSLIEPISLEVGVLQ